MENFSSRLCTFRLVFRPKTCGILACTISNDVLNFKKKPVKYIYPASTCKTLFTVPFCPVFLEVPQKKRSNFDCRQYKVFLALMMKLFHFFL